MTFCQIIDLLRSVPTFLARLVPVSGHRLNVGSAGETV